MAHRQEASPAHGLVRHAIDFRRCPWVRPLVSAYAERFETLRSLFPGNPTDPAAWRSAIARVRAAARHRDLIAGVLADQLEHRGAPRAAREAAALVGQPASVAVVTGQQAGVFGGPLYTVLKAVTAIQLARRIQREYDVPVVPVFWVDAEDHDWDEIRSATVLDAGFAVTRVTVPSMPGAGTHPVGPLIFSEGVEEAVAALERTLAPTEFTSDVVPAVRRRYRPGATVGAAFAGWLEDLLGRHGLVVFESADVRVKPPLADIFTAELGTPGRTSGLVRAAGAAMARLGHPPQVEPTEDGTNLFYLDPGGRRLIRIREGQYVAGDQTWTTDALAAEAAAHPERFSPNVVLRPIVQDRLFPTICYVAGPSELAYQAQLGGVYQAFGVEPPLLHSRASATLLDSAASRFLERHDVAFESLQAQDESVLNHLLERQLPASIDRLLHESERRIGEQTAELREAVTGIDPTLTGAVDRTGERMKETLRSLHGKIVHASKKKDETLRRQFRRTRELAFPAGHPQERELSVVYFANRYGPAFGDRLLDELPLSSSCHYLLAL